jgi:DNA ligase-1
VSPEELAKQIVEGTEIVKAVFSEIPSYDLVIPALLRGGVKGLRENCKLTPGVPLKPMLAKPTKAISEVLDRFEGHKFTCEYKYDGERAQVKKDFFFLKKKKKNIVMRRIDSFLTFFLNRFII